MVARRRLMQAIRELALGLGLFLLYVVGLPWLLSVVGYDWPWLAPARSWGMRGLAAAPLLALFGLWWRWREIQGKQHRLQRRLEEAGRGYYLLPRADAPPVRPQQVGLWAHVTAVLPRGAHLAWEVIGGEEGVHFALRTPPEVDRALLSQIMAEWPGTRAQAIPPGADPLLRTGQPGWWCELRPKSGEQPIVPVADDPLRAVLTELARLPSGVQAGVQLLVRGDPFSRQQVARKAAGMSVQQKQNRSKYRLPVTPEQRRLVRALDERARHPFVEVRLCTWASAEQEERARSVARSLARAILARYGPANPLIQCAEGAGRPGTRAFPLLAGRPWTDSELASLAHLVGEDIRAIVPQLACAPANPLPPSLACRLPAGARLSPRLRQAGEAGGSPGPQTVAGTTRWKVEEVPT